MDSNFFDVELHPASEMRELAESKSYIYEAEEKAVASLINTAAKSGELSVIYMQKPSDHLNDKLVSMGYTVKYISQVNTPQYLISWKANSSDSSGKTLDSNK